MSERLPVLSGSQLVNVLHKLGWESVRQRGSHVSLKHHDDLSRLSRRRWSGPTNGGLSMASSARVAAHMSMSTGYAYKMLLRLEGEQLVERCGEERRWVSARRDVTYWPESTPRESIGTNDRLAQRTVGTSRPMYPVATAATLDGVDNAPRTEVKGARLSRLAPLYLTFRHTCLA